MRKQLSSWLALPVALSIAFCIKQIAWLLYDPYRISNDPDFTPARFEAAGDRVCGWILASIGVSYVLFTHKLNLSSWSGRIAYIMMWGGYLYLLFFMVYILVVSTDQPTMDNVPFRK